MPYNTTSYFTNPYTPYYAQPMQAQIPANQSTQPQSGLIWVQGEAGAKSYLVSPNTTVMLMDSEAQKFYLKSSDASGMPMPLRIFTYSEELVNAPKTAFNSKTNTNTEYVTKTEFEAFKKDLNGLLVEASNNDKHE